MAQIFGIGNPLLDIVMRASHERLATIGATPGSMNLVEFEQQKAVVAVGEDPQYVPGGSCANTMRGIAWLAAADQVVGVDRVVYGGAVGRDAYAERFAAALTEANVVSALVHVDAPTGTSAILVTPDWERTMFTHLGACRLFGREHVASIPKGATTVHLAGYMWDTDSQKDAARHVVALAKAARCRVSFDIADPFVVDRFGDELAEYLPGNVDILFGNREELQRLSGETGSDEATAAASLRFASTVVLKRGADGCLVCTAEASYPVPAFPVDALDSTAAGDAFAAGFLYGIESGADLESCGRLANRVAAGIVSVWGCRYDLLDATVTLAEGLRRSAQSERA